MRNERQQHGRQQRDDGQHAHHLEQGKAALRDVTHFSRSHVFERNVGGNSAAAFLAVGSVGHDVIRAVLAGRAIDVAVVPGIVGNVAALQIRSVPGGDARRLPDQRRQSFRRGGKPAGVEIEQVERAAEALRAESSPP